MKNLKIEDLHGWRQPEKDLNVFQKKEYTLVAWATHEKPFDYYWEMFKDEKLIKQGKLKFNDIAGI